MMDRSCACGRMCCLCVRVCARLGGGMREERAGRLEGREGDRAAPIRFLPVVVVHH
jgi:hypothetical protein